MTLPVITHPTFKVDVPSTKKPVNLRPMLVKEEKILLMAKEGKEEMQINQAVKQVVQNCITSNIDVNTLTTFDLDYLFVQLRALSVDNMVKVVYEDDEDTKEYPFEVDLDKVTVKFSDKVETVVKLGDDEGIELEYPRASLYDDEKFVKSKSTDEVVATILATCVKSYFKGDQKWIMSNEKPEEVAKFIESLDIKTYNKIREFFETLPHLYYKIEYKNSLGNERSVELTTLSHFFTL
jgi:hypothetical protein